MLSFKLKKQSSKDVANTISKFDQFIENNTRNIFLEKSYTKCGAGTDRRTSKK